jgi:hypothetical protein
LQTGDPAFRALLKEIDLLLWQVDRHHLREKFAGFPA